MRNAKFALENPQITQRIIEIYEEKG